MVSSCDAEGFDGGKRARVVLELVDEDVRLSAEEQVRCWSAWLGQGPDGPLEDEFP